MWQRVIDTRIKGACEVESPPFLGGVGEVNFTEPFAQPDHRDSIFSSKNIL